MNNELPEMKMITTILMEYDLEYKDLKVENEISHNIINKAIEYIKGLTDDNESVELMDISFYVKNEILNILQGSDKE